MINFLGLSFLIGIQLLTLVLFVANFWLGIRLTPGVGIGVFILVITPFLILAYTKFRRQPFKLNLRSWTGLEKMLGGLLVFVVTSTFIVSFWYPVTAWDAVTLFDFRAKVIMHTGWISDTLSRASVYGYPLLTTLAHWWLCVVGVTTPMPLYPLFFGSFLVASFSLLRRLAGRTPALLGTLFLAVSPKLYDQSLVAYANMPFTVYLILGAAYLYVWSRQRQSADLMIGLFLSFASLWARSFPFFIVQLALVLFYLKWSVRFKLALMLLLAVFLSLKYFPAIDPGRILAMADFLKWSIISYYLPYWLLFVITLLVWFKSAKRELFWPLLIVGYTSLLFLGTYIYSLGDANFTLIPDTIQRTAMFINPAIIWFSLTVLYATFSKHRASV